MADNFEWSRLLQQEFLQQQDQGQAQGGQHQQQQHQEQEGGRRRTNVDSSSWCSPHQLEQLLHYQHGQRHINNGNYRFGATIGEISRNQPPVVIHQQNRDFFPAPAHLSSSTNDATILLLSSPPSLSVGATTAVFGEGRTRTATTNAAISSGSINSSNQQQQAAGAGGAGVGTSSSSLNNLAMAKLLDQQSSVETRMALANLLGQTSAGGNQVANILFQNAGPGTNSSLSLLRLDDLDSQQDILRNFRINSSSMDSNRMLDEVRRTSSMPPSISASRCNSALQAGVIASKKDTSRNFTGTNGGKIDDIKRIANGSSKVSPFAGDEDAKALIKRAAPFADAATSADGDRVEQKRFREQKRRSDLTYKFQELSSLLWDIDDAELDPAISLNCLTGTGVLSPNRKKRKISLLRSDPAVLPSNRIEVVARAIEVISTLRNVNRCLKEKVSNDGNEYHRNEAYLIAAAASESSKKKF
mmetsp:Transcript_25606/g.38013  ORF Transcript_25606/g.38013 Transcript_25606/m.38013 type:complete len:472 (+) Transcript_25606:81-1496(+)